MKEIASPLTFETHADGTEVIAISILHNRLQDELISLVVLAEEIQSALGATLKEEIQLPPEAQLSLQAIDRLQQTLDDLQRVMGYLSTCREYEKIEIEPLKSEIQLRHLSQKLVNNIDAPFSTSTSDSGEIAWF